MSERGVLVVITPARNEADNLPVFHDRLCRALHGRHVPWLWLCVDDHSSDATRTVLVRLSNQDARVGSIGLSRRVGSHAAITEGLRVAARVEPLQCAAVMACDLEDPPEALPVLLDRFDDGADLVFASRAPTRRRTGAFRRGAGLLIHAFARLSLPRSRYPWTGSDMMLVGGEVVRHLAGDPRQARNVFVRAARVAQHPSSVGVKKDIRRAGATGWTARALFWLAGQTILEAWQPTPDREDDVIPPAGLAVSGWVKAPESGVRLSTF